MSGILERMRGMNKLERNLFLSMVSDNDRGADLLIILKHADKKSKEAFYKGLPEDLIKFLESEIDEIEIPSKVELSSAEGEISKLLDELDRVLSEIEKHDPEEHRRMIKEARNVMKAGADVDFEMCVSDQMRGIEMPPIQKDYDKNAETVDLPKPNKLVLKKPNILDCIADRKSRRKFTEENLTIEELSYLLWATQGVREVFPSGEGSFRMVPSEGARHPFETYLAINHVENIKKGVYRYLPFEHKLVYLFSDEKMSEKLTDLACGQTFVGDSAVCFIWSTIPYRCEWRYGLEAKKDILQEAGHICQNLYLATESILCGTCAIDAYNQEGLDNFLNLDGEDEFVIYLAPVGKV